MYAKNRKDLVILHDLVYRRFKLKDHDDLTYQFAVPPKYRKRALELVHDEFGHIGINQTTSLIQDPFYWLHMDVRVHIQNCMFCIKFKQKESRAEMVCIETMYPLQLLHLDFLQIGSKKKDKGKPIYVLVATDHFTRYTKAYVTINQMAHTVAHIFINKYIANYRWPEKILMDQAKDFKGKVFKELCNQALVKKLHMTPYHPQGNGLPEQFNRTLLTMLGMLPLDSKKKWEDWVSNLTQAYNSSLSHVTGFSPYYLMFGREPRILEDRIFDFTYPETDPPTVKKYNDYIFKLRKRLEWAYKTAQMHIEKDATGNFTVWKLSQGISYWYAKRYLEPPERSKIGGRIRFTKWLRKWARDQCTKSKIIPGVAQKHVTPTDAGGGGTGRGLSDGYQVH